MDLAVESKSSLFMSSSFINESNELFKRSGVEVPGVGDDVGLDVVG